MLVEAGKYSLQDHSRLKRAGFLVAVFHRQQDLRVVLWIVWTGTQGAGDGDAKAVGFIRQRGGDLSFLVHRIDGKRKITAVFQRQHALYREAFAAHRAVDIVQINVNVLRLRVAFQVIGHFHGNVVLQGINFFIKPETGIQCAGEG